MTTNYNEGHRQRVVQKFMQYGGEVFADYELLELLLMQIIPRKDVKPLAKELLNRFGSLSAILRAEPEHLKQIKGVGDKTVVFLKTLLSISQRLSKEKINNQPILSDWNAILDYARMLYAGETVEKLRILFLNQKLQLMHTEIHQTGTVNHVPIYPREILKRALNLNASAIILIHNHPSGNPAPSKDDITATKEIEKLLNTIPIRMLDHLIIGQNHRFYSFRTSHS
ncbi:MAG: DNA repair protein RadC [Alphaproteobacteria bacterium]|nr:DNA repair protein RadC [Alphaproteobacteria bacterium]